MPDAVGRGVFATGVIILTNPNEVVIDFVQGISNPRRVAARVILGHAVAGQFAAALEENLARFAAHFPGQPRMPAVPPAAPPPSGSAAPAVNPAAPSAGPSAASAGAEPPSNEPPAPAKPAPGPAGQPIAEIYEQIRLPDEMIGGAYANVVAISHTQAEFCFDFIVSCYPRSAVTARIYLAAPRATDVLASLRHSLAPRVPPG